MQNVLEEAGGANRAEPAGSGSTAAVVSRLRVGDRVRIRKQRWTIVNLKPDTGCCVVAVTGDDAFNDGLTCSFIAPFDEVELLRPGTLGVRLVTARRWRRACRALIAADGPVDSARTAAAARIDLLPHQLEPALAILRGLGVRLLLADEVGLGKTIQAGIVVSELHARGAADRVLVLAPAGLRDQWAGELRERFGLIASVADLPELRRRAALLGAGVNPWSTIPIAIASLDYVKRPEVLPMVLACRWDVVIVDEAHSVTPESDRYAATEAICALAGYVLLLTATPHSGDERAFTALCRLGTREGAPLLMFRRQRREVNVSPPRRIHCLTVRVSAAEAKMHALLRSFTRAVRRDRTTTEPNVRLALAVLHKRALSSADSLRRSALRRLDHLSSGAAGAAQLLLPLEEAGELDGHDEAPLIESAMLGDLDEERRWLRSLAVVATAAAERETKIVALSRLLARARRLGESAIVFTEYRDTLLRVRDALGQPAAVLHGGLNRTERLAALDQFVTRKVALLLATDAAGEGLNLHHTCRTVINLELPWNPVRLEQRLGRVDRIGQARTVHAFHLIAGDAGERRVLDRLNERIARARANVPGASPLGDNEDDAFVADEIIGRAAAGDMRAADTGDATVEDTDGRACVFVDLAEEARRDHARLARVRMVTSAGVDSTPAPPNSVLITFSKRGRLRRVLAGHVIMIQRMRVDDGLGRLVSTRLGGIQIATRRRLRRGDVAAVMEWVHSDHFTLGAELASWAQHEERQHHLFWRAKLARERAILHGLQQQSTGVFQPGLFDWRAQLDRLVIAEAHDRLLENAVRRVAMTERAVSVLPPSTRPILILVV